MDLRKAVNLFLDEASGSIPSFPTKEEVFLNKREEHVKTQFGACDWSFEKDYVHVYNLFVHRRYRRKGHAKHILKLAIDRIREAGHFGDICIVADPKDESVDRAELAAFYKAMGLVVYDYYG